MGILSWIVLGLIAGIVAKLLMPGKQGGGCLTTIGLGILGAVVGGFLARLVFKVPGITGFDLRSIIIACLGAIIILVLYGAIRRR